MSKGTILYVGGFELPDKNAAAHRVLSNGKVMRELGYKVVFIDVDKTLPFKTGALVTKRGIQGFDCWSVPYPKKTSEWIEYLSSINHIRQIKLTYTDVKVIIAYNYPALALYNLKRYGARNSIKIVADCTEWYSTKGTNLVFKIIKGLDSFFRMRVVQKKLDGLIVISKFLENYYRRCKNVVRIPPLVDMNENKWTIKDSDDKSNYKKDDSKLRLVYSGSPGKNKDKINYIIDALYKLNHINNYELDIVGVTKQQFIEYYPNYENKIKELGHRIKFNGKVSHEESLQKLKQADYSIFIRDKSRLTMAGFPTKFVESVACSTPVITNSSSDIIDYLKGESYGYLISNSSIDQLVIVLEKILIQGNKKQYTSLEYSNDIFNYTAYTGKMSEMLSNISKE